MAGRTSGGKNWRWMEVLTTVLCLAVAILCAVVTGADFGICVIWFSAGFSGYAALSNPLIRMQDAMIRSLLGEHEHEEDGSSRPSLH